MKATGIIRCIDNLGRVAIPKEIRRNIRIKEGDPLEIFLTEDGGVVFRKYETDPIRTALEDANQCAIANKNELPEKVKTAIAEAARIYAEFKKENEYFPNNIF